MTRFFLALDALAALTCVYMAIATLLHHESAFVLWLGAACIFAYLAEVERGRKG